MFFFLILVLNIAYASDLSFGGPYNDTSYNIEKNINNARVRFEDKSSHKEKISSEVCRGLTNNYRTLLFKNSEKKIKTQIIISINCKTFEGTIEIKNSMFKKRYMFTKNQIRTDSKNIGLLIFNDKFILKGQMAVPNSLTRAVLKLDDGEVYTTTVILQDVKK